MTQLRPGTRVRIGDVIEGVIEEAIVVRGMTAPIYLVEWWQDGDLVARRFHAADVHPLETDDAS